jgi:hypothetical protein
MLMAGGTTVDGEGGPAKGASPTTTGMVTKEGFEEHFAFPAVAFASLGKVLSNATINSVSLMYSKEDGEV